MSYDIQDLINETREIIAASKPQYEQINDNLAVTIARHFYNKGIEEAFGFFENNKHYEESFKL